MSAKTYSVVYSMDVDQQVTVRATSEEQARAIADELLSINPDLDPDGDTLGGVVSFSTYYGSANIEVIEEVN